MFCTPLSGENKFGFYKTFPEVKMLIPIKEKKTREYFKSNNANEFVILLTKFRDENYVKTSNCFLDSIKHSLQLALSHKLKFITASESEINVNFQMLF